MRSAACDDAWLPLPGAEEARTEAGVFIPPGAQLLALRRHAPAALPPAALAAPRPPGCAPAWPPRRVPPGEAGAGVALLLPPAARCAAHGACAGAACAFARGAAAAGRAPTLRELCARAVAEHDELLGARSRGPACHERRARAPPQQRRRRRP